MSEQEQQIKREMFCRTFLTDTGAAVMEYLEQFAHFNDGAFYNDARLESYMQGRRSVICEIKQTLEKKHGKLEN